ncbi:putative uridine-cytidine kinase [Amphibalanus amphitrite]|uniref:Putative uridine-cytidine kinase n=1 Tax=Amphibalanus amphitrite TaxID=1232801 RepID=A0A6A4XEW0_AMPAM|nr:putative uridine-cytidine kinase [Amphibalanus amphitrite]
MTAQTATRTDLCNMRSLLQSTVCKRIMERLGQEAIEQEHRRVVCISQDSFYRNLSSHQSELARRGQINFDHPGERHCTGGRMEPARSDG